MTELADTPSPKTVSEIEPETVTVLTTTLNDWQSIATLIPDIDAELARLNLIGRVVIVDDGSSRFHGREELAAYEPKAITHIDVIDLATNQGNQRAQAVGIGYIASHVKTDYLIMMDGDHEDKPEYIEQLIQTCRDTDPHHIVFAARTRRQEGLMFKMFYWGYQRLYRLLVGNQIEVGNYSVCPGPLVPRLAHISALWSHYPAAIMRSRLPYTSIEAERGVRKFGKSKMNLYSMTVHAFSAFAVHADILSARLMMGIVGLGILILTTMVTAVSLRLATDVPLSGWTSIIILQLAIILVLAISAAVTIILIFLSMKMQAPMIPYWDYRKFVLTVMRLYGSGTPEDDQMGTQDQKANSA